MVTLRDGDGDSVPETVIDGVSVCDTDTVPEIVGDTVREMLPDFVSDVLVVDES